MGFTCVLSGNKGDNISSHFVFKEFLLGASEFLVTVRERHPGQPNVFHEF